MRKTILVLKWQFFFCIFPMQVLMLVTGRSWNSCTMVVIPRMEGVIPPVHFVHFLLRWAVHVRRLILSMLLVSDISSDQVITTHHVITISAQVCSEGPLLQPPHSDELLDHQERVHNNGSPTTENITRYSHQRWQVSITSEHFYTSSNFIFLRFALIYHMVKNTSENKPDDVDPRFDGHELARQTSDLFQVS